MRFRADIDVFVHDGISEPEGTTIERSLPALGFSGVTDVRVGKRITFQIDADSLSEAQTRCRRMIDEFLVNPVIERGTLQVEPC